MCRQSQNTKTENSAQTKSNDLENGQLNVGGPIDNNAVNAVSLGDIQDYSRGNDTDWSDDGSHITAWSDDGTSVRSWSDDGSYGGTREEDEMLQEIKNNAQKSDTDLEKGLANDVRSETEIQSLAGKTKTD